MSFHAASQMLRAILRNGKVQIATLFVIALIVLHTTSTLSAGTSQISRILDSSFDRLRHGDFSPIASSSSKAEPSKVVSNVKITTISSVSQTNSKKPSNTAVATQSPSHTVSSVLLPHSTAHPVHHHTLNTTLSNRPKGQDEKWKQAADTDFVASPPLPPPDDEEYIAICMLVRNQGKDMPEVLAHHYYHMGIRRFYIMDDGSDPPLSSIPDFGIPSSAITFNYMPPHDKEVKWMQLGVYDECNRKWGSKHTWMGFLDTDEFLEITDPSPNTTLKSILTEVAQDNSVGGLAINWIIHTSAGHIHRQKSNRLSFNVCLADHGAKHNQIFKSFVRTEFFNATLTPHSFTTTNGTVTVGEEGDEVDILSMMRNPPTRNKLALHHYVLKSKDEFEQKMKREGPNGRKRSWEYWDYLEGKPHVDCSSLTTYIP
jgi:Glycosyltransferase family 92